MDNIKNSIIVGILFVLFTRKWFDDLLLSYFTGLADNYWLFLGAKTVLICVLYWVLNLMYISK